MIRLPTDRQHHARLVELLGIAMNRYHQAREENGKGSLMWKYRYRLVANAGRRVQKFEEEHPHLTAVL